MISNPLSHPLHFLGLELIFAAGFVLGVRHALGRARNGDRHALFQWTVMLSYGLLMELIAFNFFDNYTHGRFTVQLYGGKLPLYVTFLYPTFHYTTLKLVERRKLGFMAEALVAGLAVCLVDIPFDTAGPDAGWWIWSATDPNLAQRWLGVPVTSYEWYLLFGAIYAGLTRALRARIARLPVAAQLAVAPLVAAAVIALGMVAFVPFHLIAALGIPHQAIVLAHFSACVILAWRTRPVEIEAPARELTVTIALLHGFPTVVLLTLWTRVADAPLKLATLLIASTLLAGVTWPRASAASPAPAPTGART